MLADTRIIARQSAAAGAMQVLAQRHEVQWRDGSSVQLHPVHAHELPMTMLRAVEIERQLHLVDLTRLVRSLDADLRRAPVRDQAGMVFYALRAAYRTAGDFSADVVRHASGVWWPVGDGWVWQPAARRMDAELLDEARHRAPHRPLAMAGAPVGALC